MALTFKSLFDYVKFKDIPYELKFIEAFWDMHKQHYQELMTSFENDIIYIFKHEKSNTHYLFISVENIFDVAQISGENQKQRIKNFIEFILLKPEKINIVRYSMNKSIHDFEKDLAIKLFRGKNIYIQMITSKGRGKMQTIPESLNRETVEILEKYFQVHYYLNTTEHPDLIIQLLKMERGEKYCP